MDDGLLGFLIFFSMMVASIFYNKRKQAMEEAAEQESAAPTPKSIIKDLTKQHKKAAAKPAVKKAFQPSSDFIGRNNYVKDELKTAEEKAEEPSPYAFESMDDVRKAFIWSEILKRKY